MTKFPDSNFLLDTDFARQLYFKNAADRPIFDYHNHLSPKDIAEHRRFRNLTELWLETDHCRKLGRMVEDGLWPADMENLGRLVQDVCYENAVRFFQRTEN